MGCGGRDTRLVTPREPGPEAGAALVPRINSAAGRRRDGHAIAGRGGGAHQGRSERNEPLKLGTPKKRATPKTPKLAPKAALPWSRRLSPKDGPFFSRVVSRRPGEAPSFGEYLSRQKEGPFFFEPKRPPAHKRPRLSESPERAKPDRCFELLGVCHPVLERTRDISSATV